MSSPVYNFELNLLFSILFFSPFHPNAICRGLFLILWEVLFPFSDFFEHFCFLFFRFLWAGADLFLAVALENLSIRIENIFLFEDTRAPNNIFISKCGDGKLNRVFLCLFLISWACNPHLLKAADAWIIFRLIPALWLL